MGRAAQSAGGPTPLRGEVRLAELVAALSLGVDLGFGQPMEHVLRQCVISLRLAEPSGSTSGRGRSCTTRALLVNVGCHSDAHEQAKWFGDDIALKADEVRPRAAQPARAPLRRCGSSGRATRRCIGSGSGWSSRSRATATSTG